MDQASKKRWPRKELIPNNLRLHFGSASPSKSARSGRCPDADSTRKLCSSSVFLALMGLLLLRFQPPSHGKWSRKHRRSRGSRMSAAKLNGPDARGVHRWPASSRTSRRGKEQKT